MGNHLIWINKEKITKKSDYNKHTNFWLDEKYRDPLLNKKPDLFQLNSILRATSNFVRIATGKNIPVRFHVNGESYTTGKDVVLSADTQNNDTTVGLALHEASHIVETNFETIREFYRTLGINEDSNGKLVYGVNCFSDRLFGTVFINMIYNKYKAVIDPPYQELKENVIRTIFQRIIAPRVAGLGNWIEDRRIDDKSIMESPGYAGYYKALYDKYFLCSTIDKLFKSGELYKIQNWKSYESCIVNSMNENLDASKLPGLQDILNIIDVNTIYRLQSTEEVLSLAIEVYKEIEKHIIVESVEQQKESKIPKEFEDALKQIADLINDKIQKQGIDRKEAEKLEVLKSSGVEIKNVGGKSGTGKGSRVDENTVGKIECIVVHNVNKSFIDKDPFNITSSYGSYKNDINQGIQLGKQLAKKLQRRDSSRETEFNHLNTGKIDKRMIAHVGYGVSSVFSQKLIETMTKGTLHISVDLSGSMSGQSYTNALILTTAISQAASMIQKLEVVVSYRYTVSTMGEHKPAIIIVYDSLKDKMTKFNDVISHFKPTGGTPEGLCFEAISNLIPAGTNALESYFINFSDGEPSFPGYSGTSACNHTKKEVDKLRAKNVKVISYFINNDYRSEINSEFRIMYGKDAECVAANDLLNLSKTLNNRFSGIR